MKQEQPESLKDFVPWMFEQTERFDGTKCHVERAKLLKRREELGLEMLSIHQVWWRRVLSEVQK